MTDNALGNTTSQHAHRATIERREQLSVLTDEHDAGLAVADQVAEIAANGSDEDLARGIEMVREYNSRELEAHLQHEEQTIFVPLIQEHSQYVDLCIQLGKEHGYLRTLIESMSVETAREDLAAFARTLRNHTLLEEEWLFPVIEPLFSEEQLQAVLDFVPFRRQAVANADDHAGRGADRGDEWLQTVVDHFQSHDQSGGIIVLFPRYQPELSATLADRLGLDFVDFQQEFMEEYAVDADSIELEVAERALRERSAVSGIVCHNIEALLCVKSEAERREWLARFIELQWGNPVLLPISVYQGDVDESHPRVCDMELQKLPKLPASAVRERVRYDIEGL